MSNDDSDYEDSILQALEEYKDNGKKEVSAIGVRQKLDGSSDIGLKQLRDELETMCENGNIEEVPATGPIDGEKHLYRIVEL